MVIRDVVGAHYGMRDWLFQRMTAVVMVLYTLIFLGVLLAYGGFDEAAWRAILTDSTFRVLTFVFLVALYWHAWVGVRDILMDYAKPTGLRLVLESAAVVALVGYAGWSIQILWGLG